jgi:hypothetical protein
MKVGLGVERKKARNQSQDLPLKIFCSGVEPHVVFLINYLFMYLTVHLMMP